MDAPVPVGRAFARRRFPADISLNCVKLTDPAQRLSVDVVPACQLQIVEFSSRVGNTSSLLHIAVFVTGVVACECVGLQYSPEAFQVSLRIFA
ncbi:hypothetical protein CT19425_U610020 [Cupriavidus taiwanensis]|uniref:Uncharacterized protein n=1 Tax=Cupriavidus taiwanensis TaxID=164546 RepID=A0A375I750_9BURK|nr:hypothetical protein CT19425_U610020 [Cupriavidus taiwanensis]